MLFCLPVFLLLAACGGSGGSGGAGESVVIPPPIAAVASGLWSDPATWGGGQPADYQEVTIPAGIEVRLDQNSPALGVLLVDGALVFGDSDLEFRAGRIEVRGKLEVGTELAPFLRRAGITLGGNPGDTDPRRHHGLWVMEGGTLDLHGEPRGPGWTRLAQTALAGSTELVLQEPVSWRSGDRIVIASTDFDMHQAEEMTVSAVVGNVVTLAAPLRYTHWGATESGVEVRAEVGLLSRNVRVQGHEGSGADGKGGHQMAMAGSTMRISGVEFTRMGLQGEVARYPVHFHMMGDATGSYVRDSSIHHNFNRCITIHGSHNAVVQGNVAYDTLGHCYFFEDGIETGNLLEGNLGLLTRKPPAASRILKSDARPGTFWISNPDNIIRGNAAAGSEALGIWYDLPLHPTGLSATDSIFPKHIPVREFSGNVTHSNGVDGFFIDPSDFTGHYDPRVGGLPEGPSVEVLFSDLTSFKNRRRGFWLRCYNFTAEGFKVADNLIGGTLVSSTAATYKTLLVNSVIVGETANAGNPTSAEPKGLEGRSLPEPRDPGHPIVGIDFYDGLVGIEGASFANFLPNSQRQAGALSGFRFNRFGINTGNFANAVTFHAANEVYFDPLGASDERPDDEDGHQSQVFLDKDGSVAGVPGRHIVVNNPFLVDAAATFVPEWNAYISDNQYGRLIFVNREVGPLPIAPVTFRREDTGQVQTLMGVPRVGKERIEFNSSVIDGRNYTLNLSGPVPEKLQLRYRYRQPGDWIEVSVPYPHTPFKVIRDGNTASPLTSAASLPDFSVGTGNVFFHDGTHLRLKLMIQAGRDNTVVEIGP
jgi:cell migration-inducing and hyaluronan-binding protein